MIENLLLAFLLIGFLQGVLEWLPVSSEAFIFLVLILFSVPPHTALIIAIALHLPTGLAAITYYRREYLTLLSDLFRFRFSPLLSLVIVATLFTAVVAVPLYFALKHFLVGLEKEIELASIIAIMLVGLAMLATGFSAKKLLEKRVFRKLCDATMKDGVLIGIIQGFSILPGVSRSGITIATFVARGFDREDSLSGSFILGGVVSLASFVFLAVTENIAITSICIVYLCVAMAIAYIVSVVSIDYLLKIARRISYPLFLKFLGGVIVVLSLLALFISSSF